MTFGRLGQHVGSRGNSRKAAKGATDETGRVGGTDTGATVADGLVRDRELAEVESNHLGLDLDGVCARRKTGSWSAFARRPHERDSETH